MITATIVVFLGVARHLDCYLLSIIAHLLHSYRPLNLLLVPKAGCGIKTVPLEKRQQAIEGLLIYRFGSNLYFANENRFTEEIIDLAKNTNSLKWFCISATNIGYVDFTAAETLENVFTQLKKMDITL